MTRALQVSAILALCALAGGFSGCGGAVDSAGGRDPRIDSLAPDQAATGATIDLLGVRFCGPAAEDVKDDDSCVAPPNGFVTFGTAPGIPSDGGAGADAAVTTLPADGVARGQIVAWKGTRISVKVPASLAPGVTKVVVTVDGLTSNQRDFTVAP